MDTTPERVAADRAIGNCHLYTTTEDDAAPLSNNTARRITAHRGAADCNGQSCKFVDVVRNTDEVVVTDITIDDRQVGCPGEKARLPIPSPELPLRAQLLTVNVPPLKIPSPELPLISQ